ncbi:MAG: xanthine dehydrogenase family protein molybdopterin-binding subunit [Chloroflexi bacterium]|nr:xanthine dehydrogenase family protein molybdopterin-binding subunit [Chloroflexota bacterium]
MTSVSGKGVQVVGTRPIRHDGMDKVTGRALYGADIQLPGLLYGKVLRSPHAHARIKSIDTSRAEALPGVRAIITAQDMPDITERIGELGETMYNLSYLKENVLASRKVLYKGHAVAAVAATSPHIAEEALALIRVEYEPLPPVMNVKEAMTKGAPLLHEDLVTDELGKNGTQPSNVAKHFRFQKGDVEKGFQQADVIVERELQTATVHQGYLEPQNATALWGADGNVTVWCSTQGAFMTREQVYQLLDLSEAKVKVVPMEIGGGFGGKISAYLEPVAALLSRKTGRPVKVVMSRSEVFEGTGPTPAAHIKVKMGANRAGRITGAEISLYYEAGAFPGSAVQAGAMCAFACYNLENAQVDGYDVVVNKPKSAAYRAPGATQAALAVETVIDELCERIGMDPLEFRLVNGVKEGDRRVDGPAYRRIGYLEVVKATREHPHYSAPLGGPNRGRGVATGFWFNAGGPSSCYLSVNADGTVGMVEGSTDIGGSRVAVAMQAAEVLGIPAEAVKPVVADTDSVGYTSVTGGSSVAFKTGLAAYEAAQDVKRQMVERAARIWEKPVEEVESANGVFHLKSDPELKMTFKDLAARLLTTGGPITGRASVNARGAGPGFAAHIVDVEVDPETGKTQVLRYTTVQDVGRAIHPSYVEGQMQGGAAQGVGWALNEEYVYNKQGDMTNSTFLDYRMPTSLDLPMIDTVIVEVPNPTHPYGVRGVGEVPIVPPPAAIANAIYGAIGIRMTTLPMSPGKVLEALQAKGKRQR